jgi:hypothetical protein
MAYRAERKALKRVELERLATECHAAGVPIPAEYWFEAEKD